MAEQTLLEFVMNLMNWIESLHEKILKYENHIETLSRDLAEAQNSNQELEARLAAYHNHDNKTTIPPVQHQHPLPQHQQTIYPITNPQAFAPQATPYVWTYDPSAAEFQVPYYEYGTSA